MMPALVDFRDSSFGADFAESMRKTGFGVVRGHPVKQALIKAALDEWAAFFALPTDVKMAYKFNVQDQFGYFPFKSENAKDNKGKPDLKEFFHVYPGFAMPTETSFDAAMELRAALMDFGQTLLDVLEGFGPKDNPYYKNLPEGTENSSNTLFRAIHYPPVQGTEEPGAVRAAAHEDINHITLLVAGSEPGLQVKDNAGNWYDVPLDPGSIIVNVGDMLQENSEIYKGGKPTGTYHYHSTTHRVINPGGARPNVSRYSIPLFIHPKSSTELSHRHTQRSYLEQRLREIGLK